MKEKLLTAKQSARLLSDLGFELIDSANSAGEVSLKEKLNETAEEMEVDCSRNMATTALCSFAKRPGKYALVAQFVSVPDEAVEALSAILAHAAFSFIAKHYGTSVSPTVH